MGNHCMLLLLVVLATVAVLAQGQVGSCKGRCGSIDPGSSGCTCDATCSDFGDCCQDFADTCLTCVGRCGEKFDKNQACQCTTDCAQKKNCCEDHVATCQAKPSTARPKVTPARPKVSTARPKVSTARPKVSTARPKVTTAKPKVTTVRPKVSTTRPRPSVKTGPITTAELHAFTEDLLLKDTNNVASQLRINRQGTTNSRSSDDKAPAPLLTVPSSARSGPTIAAFITLLNNYDPNVQAKEVVTNTEKQEETKFLNEIMKTQVMQETENFLTSRGKITRPLKDILKEIWFTLYRRGGKLESSSGFEHSFIGELRDGKVSGFHNWIQFGHEENDRDLDYKGFMQYVNLGNKGQILKGRFDWLSNSKSVGSLFVGTSPELEMALYTVCFIIKPDQKCQVKLNNKKFNVQTYTQNYKGKKLIGTAYPDI